MTDQELDQEWKPNNRPQSTMARSFSLALDDLFKIDNSLADLDAAVSEKKQKVSSQTSELEALEARLRATEERLKKAAAGGDPSMSGLLSSGRASPAQRAPLTGNTFAGNPNTTGHLTSPLATEFKPSSRPSSGRAHTRDGRPVSGWKGEARPSSANPPRPGNLPPTPGSSEGEGESDSDYVVVEARDRTSADFGQEGDIPGRR